MGDPEVFDLVVLGSGPGGEKGAAQAAYFGKKVAVVERALEVGGACVHTGTLPSKTLRETALYLTGFRRRQLYGMNVRLDRKKSLRQLVGRLHEVTDLQTRQIERNLSRHGISVVPGTGVFEDLHTVSLRDHEGLVTRRLSASFFLIATGSSPMPPRGIDIRDADVVNSDTILDLDRVPRTMTVVGGGVIGTEYACVFAALGTRITLVEGRDRLLAGTDEEMSLALQLSLERMGAEILLGDAVESVERLPEVKTNALRLKLKSGRVLRADKVLFSAGRSGNTAGLNLEAVGVAVTERGHIQVNEHFQTSVPNIYAAGDVIGFPALAAVSMEQARVGICHAFQIAYKTRVSETLPYGIYSIPEISSVGPSEQELKEKGIAYEIGRARFANNARGQITGDSDGVVKLLFDPTTRKLLAAHILGEDATELIHIPMFVISKEGTIDDFIDAVFNFPTLAETLKYAAYDGLQRLARRESATTRVESPEGEAKAPATRKWFVGLALTGLSPKAGQPVSVCIIDRLRRCRLETWNYAADGAGLLPEEVERDGFVMGVGAEDFAGRELLEGLRHRGFRLLQDSPQEAEVLPAQLSALWLAWGFEGKRPAGDPAAHRRQYEILRAQGLELPVQASAIHHDQLDAVASAYIAYLWATNQAYVRSGNVFPA
jgi:NAD(P) transhydrogenase